MKVGELISELQKLDPEAEIGCGLSKYSGWAQEINGVSMSEEGIAFIDMGRESIGENELTFASVNLSKIATRIAASQYIILTYDSDVKVPMWHDTIIAPPNGKFVAEDVPGSGLTLFIADSVATLLEELPEYLEEYDIEIIKEEIGEE